MASAKQPPQPGERIRDDLLDRMVQGVNLAPGNLRSQLGEATRLLVFLRHFGCVFCRETISDLRALREKDERFPEPLFFFQGSPMEGKAFLRRYWPDARAIADPEAGFYEAFGVQRGGLVEMFRPAVLGAARRAAKKGHANGERAGDIWRMPGVFLTRGDEVVWTHTYRHAADHPDYEEVCEVAVAVGPCAAP